MKNYLILLALIMMIASCKNKQSERKSEKFYFSMENNCTEQVKNFKNNEKKSLYFFDSKGMMDKEVYEKSPSYTLLNTLRSDSTFINYASKKFDFFVFDQNCDVGKIKTQNFDILMTPTILVVDENEKIIFKRIGPTTSESLVQNIKKVIDKK